MKDRTTEQKLNTAMERWVLLCIDYAEMELGSW